MNEPTFENWSALESKSLDDRRIERERIAMREAQIEVCEWYESDFEHVTVQS
jgi:hypothetical protein